MRAASSLEKPSPARTPRTNQWNGVLDASGTAVSGDHVIPYRKAYLYGMNHISFVTFFTKGNLAESDLLRHACATRSFAQLSQRAVDLCSRLGLTGCIQAISSSSRAKIRRHQPPDSAFEPNQIGA